MPPEFFIVRITPPAVISFKRFSRSSSGILPQPFLTAISWSTGMNAIRRFFISSRPFSCRVALWLPWWPTLYSDGPAQQVGTGYHGAVDFPGETLPRKPVPDLRVGGEQERTAVLQLDRQRQAGVVGGAVELQGERRRCRPANSTSMRRQD